MLLPFFGLGITLQTVGRRGNSWATVIGLAGCPSAVSRRANWRVNQQVHRSGDIKAIPPEYQGQSKLRTLGRIGGHASLNDFRPAPECRTRSTGSRWLSKALDSPIYGRTSQWGKTGDAGNTPSSQLLCIDAGDKVLLSLIQVRRTRSRISARVLLFMPILIV